MIKQNVTTKRVRSDKIAAKNPITKDTKVRWIAGAIYRGVWKDHNIHSWMDLFNIAFYEEKNDG